MEDHEIIGLFNARDERALTEITRKYGGYMRTIARNILRDECDAEECENDASLAAWKSIPPESPRSLRAYLGTLCRRFALNRLSEKLTDKRGGGAGYEAFEELEECIPGNTTEELFEMSELRRAIRVFMRTISKDSAIIFLQKYWYMRTLEEISHDRGMSVTAVKASLRRTREKLREYLKKEGFDL